MGRGYLNAGVSWRALLIGAAPLFAGITLTGASRAQVSLTGTYTTTQTLETLCGGCGSPSTATITSSASLTASTGNTLVGTTNSWTVLNQGTIGSTASLGGIGLLLQAQPGTVTNAGRIAITNSSTAIVLSAGGLVTNQSGGVLASTGGGGGIQITGAAGTVNNQGLITSTGAAGGGRNGVYLAQGGTVTNSGTVQVRGATASLSAGTYGVRLRNGATLINSGLIDAQAEGVVGISGATVVNSGTIRSSTQGLRSSTGTTAVTNLAGGVISGARQGIMISNAGTVSNAGTITSSSGPGVMFGGTTGNTLTNSGTIAGGNGTAIQFGNGPNTLVLQGGSSITGAVLGGTGTNTLVLQGGTLDFSLQNFSALSLSGSNNVIATPISFSSVSFGGALTVTSTLTVPALSVGSGSSLAVGTAASPTGLVVGDVTVTNGGLVSGHGTIAGNLFNLGGTVQPGGSVGTLSVTGNYTQTSAGSLAIETSPSAASKLAVAGSATIAGTLALTIGSGRYINKAVYPILTAGGGVSGTFSQITGATGSNVSFSVVYLANEIDLIASAALFAPLGRTINQRAVGAALDQAGTGTGTLATAISALAALPSDDQVRSGIDAIGGSAEGYANLASTGLATGRAITTVVGQQRYTTHGASAGGSALAQGAGATRVQLASLDPVAALVRGPSPSPVMTASPWSAWLTGFGMFGSTAGNGNAHTLNYNTGGSAVGADYRLDPSFLLGAYASYGGSATSTGGLSGGGSVDSVGGGIYASKQLGRSYLDGMLGYAFNESTLRRSIAFPGFAAVGARGNTHAHQFLSDIEAGHRYEFADAIAVTPFAGLQSTVLNQASLTETGAGALNLAVSQQTISSVRTQLGARLSRDLDLGEGVVINAALKLGWAHELSDTGSTTTARFAGTTGTGFAVQGAQRGRDTALVGVGTASQVAPNLSLHLRYDGDINGADDVHAVMGGVRLTW